MFFFWDFWGYLLLDCWSGEIFKENLGLMMCCERGKLSIFNSCLALEIFSDEEGFDRFS